MNFDKYFTQWNLSYLKLLRKLITIIKKSWPKT